jgi:nucleotide-binding universal stress UspA family protein
MKNILVPLGLSDNATHTLNYAIRFAQSTQATIYIMDSFNPSFHHAYLHNVNETVSRSNFNRIKELVKEIDHHGTNIQLVTYEGEFLKGVSSLNTKVNLDLIITGPLPNSNDDSIFLGPTPGRLVKKTDIPVLIVPEAVPYKPLKKALFAFKKGQVKGERSLDPIHFLQKNVDTQISLLLVKIPGIQRQELSIDHEVVELSNQMTSTENATVYQGVLEFFREVQPDLLIVFARERGFFEKLISSDVVYKKDFYTTSPLLVLKNRS